MRTWPRVSVVRALLDRGVELERICAGAIAVVAVTNKSCVDFDWGPPLAAAFSDGDGVVRTEAQRRFLRALVERAELWDPHWGNALKWFRQGVAVRPRGLQGEGEGGL
jgi:hypothetical protein